MAALVFSIPYLLLIQSGIYLLFPVSCSIVIFLVRIFDIARSLEERIPLRGRDKSASELEITRIENVV